MVQVLFFFFPSLKLMTSLFFLKRLHMGAHPCDGLDGMDCQIAFVCPPVY